MDGPSKVCIIHMYLLVCSYHCCSLFRRVVDQDGIVHKNIPSIIWGCGFQPVQGFHCLGKCPQPGTVFILVSGQYNWCREVMTGVCAGRYKCVWIFFKHRFWVI